MIDHLVEQTNLYANRDRGNLTFNVTHDEMRKFLGIVLFSGYHGVPSERDYWSSQPDLNVPFISDSMTINKFLTLKSFIHLADNDHLQQGNKMAKVQPMYDKLNVNLKKFGFFHQKLSIDESMLPYHGKHSCKMFIKMKPIRFGYKLWVLAGSDGFPYSIEMYQGKCTDANAKPLGFRVVEGLMETVPDSQSHCLYFDNFFTSYNLLRKLRLSGIKATGTIRSNRSGGCHKDLLSDKDLQKMERGSYDFRCDGYVHVVKWYDSSIVSVASNFQTHLPVDAARRRIGKNVEQVPQPMLISAYNTGMGGVDLFDKLLGSYRPIIRGKKWWWPFFTNVVNISVVAAWRLFGWIHDKPGNKVSNLEFRRSIVLCSLRMPQHCSLFVENDGRYCPEKKWIHR